MRDSFIFYRSFYDAAQLLGDKARLKLYDSIMELALCCSENVSDLERVCDEVETKLARNRNVFAQFLLIKPQIFSNFERFINGRKGAESGHLGGAPKGNKNASKNNPKTTPNVNDNVNVNVNEEYNLTQEDKSSFVKLADPPISDCEKKYEFSGSVIKLNRKDYERWRKEYPDLNLYAELVSRDDWLSKQDENAKTRWFITTASHFANQNEVRKKQHSEQSKEVMF